MSNADDNATDTTTATDDNSAAAQPRVEPLEEAEGFDLASFDALLQAQEDGADVDILHPKTRQPIGLKITVAGPDSRRARLAEQWAIDQRAKLGAKEWTLEDAEAEQVAKLARCMVGWEWGPGITVDGKALPFSVANAERLLNRFRFIAEQVMLKQGNRANFMPA